MLLAGSTLHTDLSPQAALGGLFGWMLTMLGQTVGYPVPEGGAGRLTEALVARLVSRGGQLRCRAEVTEVVVRDGTAVGVGLAGGERVRAAPAAVADVIAPELSRDLIG